MRPTYAIMIAEAAMRMESRNRANAMRDAWNVRNMDGKAFNAMLKQLDV